jgi:predicted RNase H-like HicB family nuclease
MQSLINKIKKSAVPQVDFSSVMVVYKAEEGLWRGFVMPFDITYEAETREAVVSVLKEMIDMYVDGLREYKSPKHLSDVPLSNTSDIKKWMSISQELTNKLLNKVKVFEGSDYYAEAQLPA